MKTYLITIQADEKWLEAIQKFTDVDVYQDEYLNWVSIEEVITNG